MKRHSGGADRSAGRPRGIGRLAVAACLAAVAASAEGPGRAVVCSDYTQGRVFILSAAGQVEWEHPAPRCNDVWALPNGNLLFVTGHGVREVTRDKATVFEYRSASEIYACQRLPNGHTFIAECNAGRLLEVDPAGGIAKEIRLLPEGRDGGHAFIRNARKMANGNYLVCHYGDQVVREYDPSGAVAREIPAAGGPHSAIRLPDGNTLIAIGDRKSDAGPRVIEVDASGAVVWEVKNGDLPGILLTFMTGLQRLPNGHTLMTNWVGHGKFGAAPHLFEVTRDKRVLWSNADHQTFRTLSSVQCLDTPGDATRGEILH